MVLTWQTIIILHVFQAHIFTDTYNITILTWLTSNLLHTFQAHTLVENDVTDFQKIVFNFMSESPSGTGVILSLKTEVNAVPVVGNINLYRCEIYSTGQ